MRYFKGNRAANLNKIRAMDCNTTRLAKSGLRLWAALLVAGMFMSLPLQAQQDRSSPEYEEYLEDRDSEEEDFCDWYLENQPIQEQSQEILRSWSCHTFRWFDSWWGDEHEFRENEVNGWVTAGFEYRKYDGFSPRLRLKVRAPLPNLDNRFDVMLGRVDEENYVSDSTAQDQSFYNPGLVDRGNEDSWMLGLGKRRRNARRGWDWSLGARLRWPPEPYAKLSWFAHKQFNADTDVRFRQTFFWRSEEGFGTTSRADLLWSADSNDIFRWEGIVRFSEDTEGARFYYGHSWYHLLSNGSTYTLLTFVNGETGHDVEIQDGGFQLSWRFPFTRDYLYLAMGPSITWPREELDEKRELNLGFGIWIEMEFGNWRD